MEYQWGGDDRQIGAITSLLSQALTHCHSDIMLKPGLFRSPSPVGSSPSSLKLFGALLLSVCSLGLHPLLCLVLKPLCRPCTKRFTSTVTECAVVWVREHVLLGLLSQYDARPYCPRDNRGESCACKCETNIGKLH